MNMALLNTIMANLGSVTCIGQQRWRLLLIQVYLGSCANNQMPQPQLWVCTCLLCHGFFSLSFDSSSTCRLTLGMVSTVIPSTQTLLKNQKYARKLGADGRPIFTLLILWSCKEYDNERSYFIFHNKLFYLFGWMLCVSLISLKNFCIFSFYY